MDAPAFGYRLIADGLEDPLRALASFVWGVTQQGWTCPAKIVNLCHSSWGRASQTIAFGEVLVDGPNTLLIRGPSKAESISWSLCVYYLTIKFFLTKHAVE
jgi:hypothetical protein